MVTEIKFVCSTCGQHIAVPREAVDETISCPICGTGNVVLSASATMLPKHKSHKFATAWILFAGVGCFVVVVLLTRLVVKTSPGATKPEATTTGQRPATNIVESSNSPVAIRETTPQPVLIEGLFGIKLGEALPPSCKITDASETSGRFWVRFIPPETNSLFITYDVCLDATERLVAVISGQGKYYDDNAEFERTRNAIITKFRERYGKEEFWYKEGMYFDTYTWKRGKRDVTLTEYIEVKQLTLSCTDNDLYDSVEKSKPPVDTRGL